MHANATVNLIRAQIGQRKRCFDRPKTWPKASGIGVSGRMEILTKRRSWAYVENISWKSRSTIVKSSLAASKIIIAAITAKVATCALRVSQFSKLIGR